MISRSLIQLLNSGNAISIVGSGASIDAGLPMWNALFTSVVEEYDREGYNTHHAREIAADPRGTIPLAFDALAELTNRTDVHHRVATLISTTATPGPHHRCVANWPFRFHITTNYDHLLEAAFPDRLTSVGNIGSDLHKVGGGTLDFVWHVHGGCRLPPETSHLVLGKSDYDEIYPYSNMVTKLQAVTTAHRCVFFGFGFTDTDLSFVLEAVGRLSHSGEPSFAFLGYDVQTPTAKDHQDLLRRTYNVEVIPYRVRGDDHSDLDRLLHAYTPFLLLRSLFSGTPRHTSPTYDPVGSALNVQSRLDLSMSGKNAGLKQTLVGARVLAHIRENPGADDGSLEPLYRSGDPSESEIRGSLASLRDSGAVTPPPNLDLTPDYWKTTESAIGQLKLTRDQFYASLRARVHSRECELAGPSLEHVVNSAASFLETLCRERGLGVAQNLATSDTEQVTRRIVSLVQELPKHLAHCPTEQAALALVQLVADILAAPTESESRFLGLLCQAYFGHHLVGASDLLARVDLDLIEGTCYVVDASLLVCLLAEGSDSHDFATSLVNDVTSCGGLLTTTSLFLEEIEEHARWAGHFVEQHGEDSSEVISALRCLGGYASNEFLHGYFLGSPRDSSFPKYLRRMLGTTRKSGISTGAVAGRLLSLGVRSVAFSDWHGFVPEDFEKRDRVRDEIEKRRKKIGTYTHTRQTTAEAEVAVVVDGIRSARLRPPTGSATDAFFLSGTRVVDQLDGLTRRICLFPVGLAQWIWSARSVSAEHSELVFQQLLWELAQGGVGFVDDATLLRRFSGVIEVAAADLQASVSDRREHLLEKYGADPADAFVNANRLDIPRLASEVRQEALDRMEALLEKEKERVREARATAKLSDDERRELDKARAKKRERQRKATGKRLNPKRGRGRARRQPGKK